MCLAIIGQIESIDENLAIVNIFGIRTKVNVILIEGVRIGDYVLVHTGFAIEKVSQEKALSIEYTLKQFIGEDLNG